MSLKCSHGNHIQVYIYNMFVKQPSDTHGTHVHQWKLSTDYSFKYTCTNKLFTLKKIFLVNTM